MPPISCTSKWRWPSVRLAASRTVAKAGTRMSSSDLQFGRARLQRVVGKRSDFGFEGVDGVDAGLIALDAAVVGSAEELAGERADHPNILSMRGGAAALSSSNRSPSRT
jgi:hypothetical protein